MKRLPLLFALACFLPSARAAAGEERLRGVLEPTAHPDACAQLTDALRDTYYIPRTPEAERLCKQALGRRVLLVGTVEERPGDAALYFWLKELRVLEPPPAAPPRTAPPASAVAPATRPSATRPPVSTAPPARDK